MQDETLTDNTAASHYELNLGGSVVAFANYRIDGDTVRITHTEVTGPEGQGLGSRLARLLLAEIRQRGQGVVPQCDFIAGWIARHPEYADLVRPG
ncbi:MAG: N-acetyltransferase [Ramlibacter sp.]|nr:N-acetyltransferase [Ramlibacter sp.]